MKSEERSYIAEIERYFLGLAGKGLMLSSRDYGFIRELGRRSVSRELAIKAIAYGFDERRRAGKAKPRGLFDIKEQIEQYLKTWFAETRPETQRRGGGDFAEKKAVESVVRNLDRVIMEEKRVDMREKYGNLRGRVLEMAQRGSSSVYGGFALLWRSFLDDVLSDLSQEQRRRVDAAAREKLPSRAKFYDEDTREKTLRAFRDEILVEELGIENVFGTK